MNLEDFFVCMGHTYISPYSMAYVYSEIGFDSAGTYFENYQREMKTLTTRFKKVIDRQSSTVRNLFFIHFY